MLSELNSKSIQEKLLLFQLTSSAFPSGSYTHSSGFESLLEDGIVKDAESLHFYLKVWLLESVARSDAPSVALTHKYIENNQPEQLIELSNVLTGMKYSRGSFNSSVMVGKATFKNLVGSFSSLGRELESYMAFDPEEEMEYHHAIIWGLITKIYGVGMIESVSAFLFSTFSGVLEVIARIIPLGQTDTQKILSESYGDLFDALNLSIGLGLTDLSSQSAIQDIAAMKHERLSMKLCIT